MKILINQLKPLLKLIIPVIIGYGIGVLSKVYQVDIIVRILYTISTNFLEILMWLAPILTFTYVVLAITDLGKNAMKFLLRYFFVITTTLLILGAITLAISYLIVPLFVVDSVGSSDIAQSAWVDAYFNLPSVPKQAIFIAIISALIIGLISKKDSSLIKGLTKIEKGMTQLVYKVVLPVMPIWIIGVFAASGYQTNFGIFLTDFLLSFLILSLQGIWIIIMLLFVAKKTKYSFKPIFDVAVKVYLTVTAILGNGGVFIINLLVSEQKKLKFDENIAKFGTAMSFNMPGSLISHIIFAYGISIYFNFEINFWSFVLYVIVLVFFLMAAPAIPGGVFATTAQLLTPILGFNQAMIDIMAVFYYRQGTSNSAINNVSDLYVTPLVEKK